jgi:CheY-like chemotaxis protein/two-component sensor histidine kinase
VAELKTVNLKEIIVHLKNLLARLVREDIDLRITTGEDCFIRVDSTQIEQVMMNLVTNARDAMQDGGILTIRMERFDIGEDFVRRHGYGEPGRYALISVSDTGAGMDDKTREKIFEPFFTSKAAGKGTGLGLSIVYGIVKQHNGYIDVQSEPGKGTTFNIYLPLIGDIVEKTEPVEDTDYLPQGSELLLLADDDPVVRDLTRELLQEFGYSVIDAEDGDDAVNKFMSRRNEISMVILDAIMPKKNGMEVYNEIRNHRPEMKALFISGYTGDVLNRKGMLDNKLDIISKPFVQSALLRKVREIIDR